MSETEAELKGLVTFCLEGNGDARVRFQRLFGEFIYNYPFKMFRLSQDKATDFYIYVFENDRIFRRLRGFEGRNGAHFRTYLGGFVLRDLFLEWRRGQKELETVSLETIMRGNDSKQEGVTLQDLIADPKDGGETSLDTQDESAPFRDLLASLDMEKRVILKLLHLLEFDLSPQEIRFICQKSGGKHREVVALLENTRSGLTRKDEQFTSLHVQLESIFGWVLIYQNDLAGISETLKSVAEGSPKHTELCRQKEELERKLKWRYRQREQALAKAKQFRVTTSYKDIARLLNIPLGTVCSLIARIRTELIEAVSHSETAKQAAVL